MRSLATLKYGILEDKGFLLLTARSETEDCLIKLLVKTSMCLLSYRSDLGWSHRFSIFWPKVQMGALCVKGDFLIVFNSSCSAYSTQQKVLPPSTRPSAWSEMLEQVRLLSTSARQP
jgi:hypothetical protein